MANLPESTLITVANLLPRLFQVINLATETEFNLFERYGETEETLPELEELNNAAERVRSSYNRLYGLVLQVAQTQPAASSTIIDLLYRSIEMAVANADASEASVREVKRSWNKPMTNNNQIPDAQTRARNVARLREVCLKFDELNMLLAQANAQAEIELQNSPLYVRRRQRVQKQLETEQAVLKNG